MQTSEINGEKKAKKIKFKHERKKYIPEQMQTHCQCKQKQISFVLYFKIKDNIMLPVVIWLKYENNMPFNQKRIRTHSHTHIQTEPEIHKNSI